MRTVLCALFLLFLTPQVFGAVYIDGLLKNGIKVSGELLEIYTDRWFYQPDSPLIPRYMLLFNKDQEDFHFFPVDELSKDHKKVERLGTFKNYLREKGLFFKNELVKDAFILTGNEGHHKFEKMYGNFAWDIGLLNEDGKQFNHQGKLLEDYLIFGAEVVSPLKGIVVGKVDGQLDNLPDLTFSGDLAGKVNNFLTIQVEKNIYLSIVHFKKGTIEVEVGDQVTVGQRLGEVGNSGVSYLPHLHYTLYTYIPKYNRFISIPGYFE